MNKLLSKKDVQNNLNNLNGWMYDNNKIKKELQFLSYMDSIDFIKSVFIDPVNGPGFCA